MSYLTPNMNLVIPTPGTELSPNWSLDLNTSLVILDTHNHTPGNGVQIPTSGININADLSFNNVYNLINARSIALYPNATTLSGATDLCCVYSAGGNFYFNNSGGTPVQITSGSSVLGATGTITGLSGTASAAYVGANGSFVFQQATSTAANLDSGTLIIRYPGSYPSPSGNYIAIQAPSSLASAYSLTLPALPSQTNVMTMTSAGVLSSITYDSVGSSMTSTGANAIAASMTSTGANTIASTMNSTGANTIASTSNNASFGGKSVQESGNNLVVSNANATNSLSIIRGRVNSNGTIAAGEGFTVSVISTGVYEIIITTPFYTFDVPVVVCSAYINQGTSIDVVHASDLGTSNSNFYIRTQFQGNVYATSFEFIAIGQRA